MIELDQIFVRMNVSVAASGISAMSVLFAGISRTRDFSVTAAIAQARVLTDAASPSLQ